MGLAVQAPADPLLAIFAEPTAGEGATGAQPLADGLFATLLADILDGQLPSGAEDAAPGVALPVNGDDTGDQTLDDPALAMLASIAALQAVPQPLPATPPAESSAGPSGPAGASDGGVAPENALSRPAGEPSALTGQASPLPSGPVTPIEPTPSDGTPAAVEPATRDEAPTAELASASTAAGVDPPEPPSEVAPPGSTKAVEPPPGEVAPPPQAEGVVRSVGNATESNSRGNDGGQPGRKPEDTRPLPRASENGIAHAAANSAVGELRVAAATEPPAPENVAAPAPPEPPAELPQQVDQVASAVIERVEAGGGEARIHLEPLELGEVTIHVRTDGDEVRIEIRAERPDAARLLRDHTQDLSSLLGSRGLNLSDVNVGVGGGNAGGLFENQREQPRPVVGGFAAVLGLDDEPSSASRHNRLRAAYNPDGALLYRV